jgi:hypothetical protein
MITFDDAGLYQFRAIRFILRLRFMKISMKYDIGQDIILFRFS